MINTLSYAMTYAKMGTWKMNFQTQEFQLSKELMSLLELPHKEATRIPMEEFISKFVMAR